MMRLIAAFLLALTMHATALPVATAEGPVEGINKNEVTQFLGIPYARPPVGALRWMPPQPVMKWTTVKQANGFGPICAQVTTLGPFAGPPNSNEDCLYLNVFTPNLKGKLPVLVWIHGGGYFDGASNDYDASRLAARGKLVVVTFNYRLNLFGFLDHPALGPSGNFGIMDMQAVLKWVRRNAAAFGGDPGNVTAGGQSAGAGAAAALVVSPASKDLMHRAIFQSGGYTPFSPKAVAQARARKFAAATGCTSGDVAKCLRALPAAKVAAMAGTASATSPFVGSPMVDGTIIPRQMIDAVNSGQFNKMPIMIGTTRDEGNFSNGIIQYFKPGRAALDDKDYQAYVTRTFGGNAGAGGAPPVYPKGTIEKIRGLYGIGPQPKNVTIAVDSQERITWNNKLVSAGDWRLKSGAKNFSTAQLAWNAVHSDSLACRGQYTAAALARQAPVYMYIFTERGTPSYFPKMPGYQAGAYHTADIPYLFTGYHGGPQGLPVALDAGQQKLSDRMIDAWANFARSGNPNGAGDAPWPRWKKGDASPAYFLQDQNWKTVQTNGQFAAVHNCGFWNSILLYK